MQSDILFAGDSVDLIVSETEFEGSKASGNPAAHHPHHPHDENKPHGGHGKPEHHNKPLSFGFGTGVLKNVSPSCPSAMFCVRSKLRDFYSQRYSF